MLKLAEKKALFPVIVFSFVRLECESFAMQTWNESMKSGSLDFTTEEEKAAIEQVTPPSHTHAACTCRRKLHVQLPHCASTFSVVAYTSIAAGV